MEPSKKVIFISHIATEHSEATAIKEYVEKLYPNTVDVFISTSWDSIAPGDDWFKKIEEAINSCEITFVLCSPESVSRPWIFFETGAAWFSKKKVIPLCHKGMTPNGLPAPMVRLQGVDVNAGEKTPFLARVADVVSHRLALPEPEPISAEELPPAGSLQGWFLRPMSHLGEIFDGTFKVGSVETTDPVRAREAELDPDDTVFVRLYLDPSSATSELSFIHTMASGPVASFFETPTLLGKNIRAKVRLKAFHRRDDGRGFPLVVVDSACLAGDQTSVLTKVAR